MSYETPADPALWVYVKGRCEMEDCTEMGVAEVHAQWTVVDFVAYTACDAHVEDVVQALSIRTVDGQAPVDVWVKYFPED